MKAARTLEELPVKPPLPDFKLTVLDDKNIEFRVNSDVQYIVQFEDPELFGRRIATLHKGPNIFTSFAPRSKETYCYVFTEASFIHILAGETVMTGPIPIGPPGPKPPKLEVDLHLKLDVLDERRIKFLVKSDEQYIVQFEDPEIFGRRIATLHKGSNIFTSFAPRSKATQCYVFTEAWLVQALSGDSVKTGPIVIGPGPRPPKNEAKRLHVIKT